MGGYSFMINVATVLIDPHSLAVRDHLAPCGYSYTITQEIRIH